MTVGKLDKNQQQPARLTHFKRDAIGCLINKVL